MAQSIAATPSIFEPLDVSREQIRVMKIHRGENRESPIRCTLYTVSLQHNIA